MLKRGESLYLSSNDLAKEEACTLCGIDKKTTDNDIRTDAILIFKASSPTSKDAAFLQKIYRDLIYLSRKNRLYLVAIK
jgi:hypothetical protein